MPQIKSGIDGRTKVRKRNNIKINKNTISMSVESTLTLNAKQFLFFDNEDQNGNDL